MAFASKGELYYSGSVVFVPIVISVDVVQAIHSKVHLLYGLYIGTDVLPFS